MVINHYTNMANVVFKAFLVLFLKNINVDICDLKISGGGVKYLYVVCVCEYMWFRVAY